MVTKSPPALGGHREHHGDAAPSSRDHPRVGVPGADRQEPVDHGISHARRVGRAVVGDRQQVDADAVLLQHVGHGAEQGDGVRVAEGVGQLVGVDDADRIGAAVPQGPTGRARSVVTELGTGGQDARPHVLGQLLGTVVGVGDGGDRDSHGCGHVLHRHAWHAPHPRSGPRSAAQAPTGAWPAATATGARRAAGAGDAGAGRGRPGRSAGRSGLRSLLESVRRSCRAPCRC